MWKWTVEKVEMSRHMATLAQEGSVLRTLVKWLLDASQHKGDCSFITYSINDYGTVECDCGSVENMRDARLAASKYLREGGNRVVPTPRCEDPRCPCRCAVEFAP